ncbi:pentatricopeptide repeat-containing protein At2g20710, mitochondrial-like isoform X1 [Cynara cardunculus var. scolymus]|uniref:Pentatricopeptide repeat-containing protein n=1 Tax=Cynara cardunculus var. scolymus TaxID=59895 RepID=A0A103XTL0_CYNCS|nr:pentatricopeptide repeat-containing protein At2g20710, mitochondrial-like isoform X1 [Cynara cardunculus var. scolymus]KVH96663.1 Pentatricopeptide repeat-containing protein [Cynara cardunculus var. scolymus]
MMIIKKLRTPLVSWDEFCFASSRVFWVLAYSTQTLSPNDVADTSSTAAGTTLYHRLVRFRDPSVVPVLDLWVQEGRAIDQEDLHVIIKQLRKFGRYKHALQICRWMNDKPYLDVSYKDVSVELDLISKVYGLKKAEEYFNKIPNTSRVWQVYGALLNCYAKAKALEKAEATMQKMRELGYSRSLTYNVMMGLYSATEKYEKLDLLMEEMEQKGIRIDKFTYAIRLNAYAKTLEIRKMEMLLLKMEVDPEVTMEWHAYTLIANGYLKAGEKEKALMSLKKSEYLIRPSQRKSAYEILLTLYASAGRKDEVYRIWNLYKNIGKFYNHGYLCLLSSLAKLDCIDDVEKIYEEWEAQNTYFDFHVPNLLITMYCKKGLLEKAETLVKKLIESGKEPNASTWSRMAMGYVKNDGMEKAVEAMRKSILGSFHGWTVDTATLSACLDYLDHKGHLNEAEEMIKSLHQKGHLSEGVYMGILKNLSRKPLVQDLI